MGRAIFLGQMPSVSEARNLLLSLNSTAPLLSSES
jgi:hypothetical protein